MKHIFLVLLTLLGLFVIPGLVFAQSGQSTAVTSSCTGSPCPWGAGPFSDNDLVWTMVSGARNTSLGYTYSHNVIAPAQAVNGATINISGGAYTTFYAVNDTSQRVVDGFGGSGSYTVAIDSDEWLLVEGSGWFAYTITNLPVPATSTPTATAGATSTPTAGATSTPTAGSGFFVLPTVIPNQSTLDSLSSHTSKITQASTGLGFGFVVVLLLLLSFKLISHFTQR